MAVAGKVAITPRGAWDGTVLYDKLSLVTHENAIYIAKKQSQGVVPVDGEYWMFCMQNAGAEDIQNIVNGTTVVGKANSLANSPKINGVEFDGTKDIEVSDRKYCMVGSDVADSVGWYKVAEQTMSAHNNSNVTFKVTSTFGHQYSGILELQMRSGSSSIQYITLKWHSRIGFSTDDVICVINGVTYTIYIHNKITQYGRVMFEILSESSRARAQSGITLFNSDTPEETEPVPTYISEDGATVLRAIQDSSGNNIVDTYFPKNKVVNNKVTTESGYAVDARQLNETVEGSYAKGVAEDISKINADLNQFLSNPRVEKDANELSGLSKMSVSEYSSKSANLPTPDWYHIMNFEGRDELFKSQLAVGMTTDRLFMRRKKDAGVWQNWLEIMTSSQSQLVQGSYTPVFNVENTGSADFTYTKQSGTYVRCGHLMFVESQITGTVSNVTDIESNSYLQMTLPQIDGKNYMIGLATLEYATGLGAIKSPYDTNLNEEQFHPVLRNNNINFYCAGNVTKPVAGGIIAGIVLVALLVDK